ncbi:hypothetical protein B0H16DRAFT_955384 [Mycena metata]|uniref:Uncharacterized protein n=1 Tax=Mycena metata TaxID=1033252 RepID=A0AAD7K5V8_9AGAR|nr:hypothetical protein B0H16DRAFT_955384 [Mycena metata]
MASGARTGAARTRTTRRRGPVGGGLASVPSNAPSLVWSSLAPSLATQLPLLQYLLDKQTTRRRRYPCVCALYLLTEHFTSLDGLTPGSFTHSLLCKYKNNYFPSSLFVYLSPNLSLPSHLLDTLSFHCSRHLVPPRTHSPIHIHIPSPIPPSNPPPPTRWIPIYALDYQYLSAERRATFFGCFVARPGHRSYIHRPRPWTLDPLISPHLCTTQCRADPPVVRRSVPLPLLQPAKSIHSFWSWRLPAADESGFWLWVEGQGFRARGRADIDVRIVFVCTTTIHTPAHQPRLPRRETS